MATPVFLALVLICPAVIAQDETKWFYAHELELIRRGGGAGSRIRVARANLDTGSVRSRGGVPVWLHATRFLPATESSTHKVLPVANIRNCAGLARNLDAPVALPVRLVPGSPAVKLFRRRLIARDRHGREISALAGVVQKNEAYFGQVELRRGTASNVSHSLRVEQWAGTPVEEGYPVLQWIESVHSNGPNPTRAPDQWHSADMERGMQLFPAAPDAPARVVVRLLGTFSRPSPGAVARRRVHLVCEFRRENGQLRVGFDSGYSGDAPFMRDGVYQTPHETAWRETAGAADPIRVEWETPYQPLSPRRRGVRNLAMFVALDFPRGWSTGRWDGAPVAPKDFASRIRRGRLHLKAGDLVWVRGAWRFDGHGHLVADTPLGRMSAKQVFERFRDYFRRASEPDQLAARRDFLELILEWAEQLPHLPGHGRKDRPPGVRRLLNDVKAEWRK